MPKFTQLKTLPNSNNEQMTWSWIKTTKQNNKRTSLTKNISSGSSSEELPSYDQLPDYEQLDSKNTCPEYKSLENAKNQSYRRNSISGALPNSILPDGKNTTDQTLVNKNLDSRKKLRRNSSSGNFSGSIDSPNRSSTQTMDIADLQSLQLNDELCSIIGTEVTNSIANEPANVQLGARVPMSSLVDKEFQEGDLDIFSAYEFNMLSDQNIQQLLVSRGVIHPELNKFSIIKKEFNVAYEYTFKAWIEERSFLKKVKPAEKNEKIEKSDKIEKTDKSKSSNSKSACAEQAQISNPWNIPVNPPTELFKEGCKQKIMASKVTTCPKCDGKGRKYCNDCKATGFIGCPQCRGVGFGNKKYMGSSKSMMSAVGSSSSMQVCMRCRGQRTIPCNSCGASFSKGNCCKTCQGKCKVKTERVLKSTWQCYEDRVAVGKFTSKIPEQLVFDAYGVSIHDDKACLNEELCPDRPDLVQLSEENPVRIGTSTTGKIIRQNHFLKAVPVCAASAAVQQPDGRQILKTYFIVGQINCGLWEMTHNVSLGDTGNFFQFNRSQSVSAEKKTSSMWKKAVRGITKSNKE